VTNAVPVADLAAQAGSRRASMTRRFAAACLPPAQQVSK
jgi:hypothetical protein